MYAIVILKYCLLKHNIIYIWNSCWNESMFYSMGQFEFEEHSCWFSIVVSIILYQSVWYNNNFRRHQKAVCSHDIIIMNVCNFIVWWSKNIIIHDYDQLSSMCAISQDNRKFWNSKYVENFAKNCFLNDI